MSVKTFESAAVQVVLTRAKASLCAMVVDGWLARAAAARPEHPALQTPEATLSYEQLYADARAGAAELAGLGAARGTRVGIALPAGLDFARALHACLLLGAPVVPIDLRLSESERSAGAARLRHRAGGAAAAATRRWAWPRRIAERLAAGRDGAQERHDLDATALVMHTSGSSAAPKEVELTYGNLLWSALGSAVALGAPAEERWLCVMPLSHMGGLSILVRSTIYATTAVVHEGFELDARAARAARGARQRREPRRHHPAAAAGRGPRARAGLRCVLLGGGPVAPSLLERARAAGIPVALTYGLTEACSQVATAPVASLASDADQADGDRRAGPARAPSRHPARRRAAAVLHRRPDRRGRGDPRARADRRARRRSRPTAGCTRATSASSTSAGRLSVLGRRAETIISGGENVAPAEVESVLESHPLVLEAGVFGVADEQWGEAVSAVVVLRRRDGSDERESLDGVEELRAHCARALAPYKVPKRISFAQAPLPRTRSGKLLRRELR